MCTYKISCTLRNQYATRTLNFKDNIKSSIYIHCMSLIYEPVTRICTHNIDSVYCCLTSKQIYIDACRYILSYIVVIGGFLLCSVYRRSFSLYIFGCIYTYPAISMHIYHVYICMCNICYVHASYIASARSCMRPSVGARLELRFAYIYVLYISMYII